MGRRWHAIAGLGVVVCAAVAVVTADQGKLLSSAAPAPEEKAVRKRDANSYHHVWPPVRFGWRIALGSLIGIFGAAFGSAGGVGGGGIFMPMLTLIIGFDPKSSTAISKCMIMGTAVSTVYYNLRLKHPTLDMPLIDYDLALLMQPMLMLGVSIGVLFNVIFPDWLVTALMIIIFLGLSTKAYQKGIKTWKKETIIKTETAKRLEHESLEPEHATIETNLGSAAEAETTSDEKILRRNNRIFQTSIRRNVYWKELAILAFVWVAFLVLQIAKNYTASCSMLYWFLNSLQIPVSLGTTMYEAHGLMNGKRVISSNGSQKSTLKFRQLFVYSLVGLSAGIIGGLIGISGGSIMGAVFLELGIPPQVSSATATFVMMFSSSMSVIEYYLMHWFPVPYAAYFTAVTLIAAIIGQHYAKKLIDWLGRASLIIFILASILFISTVSLGGVGISKTVHKMQQHQYMGFEDLCKYGA
ncbi:hypothetical protein ACP4OV_031789 [Aristida adscensionis]